jgi:hypothetical protein
VREPDYEARDIMDRTLKVAAKTATPFLDGRHATLQAKNRTKGVR